MPSSKSGLRCRAAVAATLAAGFVASGPAMVSATNTINQGGPVRSGTLSAKLLSGAVSADTPRRQSILICDPDEPINELTSVYYDRDYARQNETVPRVSVRDIMPGPGYEIIEAWVEVRQLFVNEFEQLDSRVVFQDLNEFRDDPAGEETGFVRMQARRTDEEVESRRIPTPVGFTETDYDGPAPGEYSVDTHAWIFEAINTDVNDAEVVFTHLAVRGDQIVSRMENGAEYVVFDHQIVPATVVAPEPGSSALLGMAALGLLARRRRPR